MKKKIILPLLILLVFTGFSSAQTTEDKTRLEQERQQLQKELNDLQNQYKKVSGQKKQTLGQLNMLNRKITLQERYISNINRELRMIDDDIYLSNLEIYRLQKQLDTLKAEYARTVVYAYKNRSTYDYLNFIFSASSFNDAVKRVSYLKSYRAYREKQVNNIIETQAMISKRKQQQLVKKDNKNAALQNQTHQVSVLAEQKKEKDAVVSKLKAQESEISKQLADKKKRDRDLQNAIAAIVKREIESAKKEAEKKAAEDKKNVTTGTVTNPGTGGSVIPGVTTNPSPGITMTSKPQSYLNFNESDVRLNQNFELNRGKLPWPVDNGYVSIRFGSNKIEKTLLTFDSPGITISTPTVGAAVKAVFDGEVAGVYNIGDGMVVTIRHGKYFTTYSNLSSVNVSKGTVIKTGQAIGKVGRADDGGGGQLDFLLMIESKNVNPEVWLHR
jgi:septal ring factor EnvC (AmiA/AmiB activator)